MSKDNKIEKGMDTEAIATLLRLQTPPKRQEGEGINAREAGKELGITKDTAKKQLLARDDLSLVIMSGYNNRETHVFMPKEDAEAKYPDWIIQK